MCVPDLARSFSRYPPPMLQLRPTCEHCNAALPPDSTHARICSFECTFCARCVDELFDDVCPNCGGGLAPRPVRPKKDWKGGNFLGRHPARTDPVHRPKDLSAHANLVARVGQIAPEDR